MRKFYLLDHSRTFVNQRVVSGFIVFSILILGITGIVHPFDKQSNIVASDLNEFHINGIAFAQTYITSGNNSTDPYGTPQDSFTNPNAIPQNNFTDPSTTQQDTPTDPFAAPQDNLTNTQNQTSNASTPEFGPVSVLVLTIGIISIILVSMKSRFSLNIK
jgi:predicted secreted protein with PEFG-CTERM motif